MASSNVLINSNYELSVREYQSISQSLRLHVMPDVIGTDTDEAVSLSLERETDPNRKANSSGCRI